MRKDSIVLLLILLLGVLFFQGQPGLSNSLYSGSDDQKSSKNIAVAAIGDSANSIISDTAGRAPYYLIFDESGVFLKSIKNPYQGREHRASSGVVNLLLKESCTMVIAGNYGNKMENQLRSNKIEYHQRKGIAKKVVQELIKNKKGKNAQN